MLCALAFPLRKLKPQEGDTLLRPRDRRARLALTPLLTRDSPSDEGLAQG